MEKLEGRLLSHIVHYVRDIEDKIRRIYELNEEFKSKGLTTRFGGRSCDLFGYYLDKMRENPKSRFSLGAYPAACCDNI